MKLDPLLNKAASLAKRRDYDNALRLLKAEEERYFGYFKYYYLCAVICLHKGAFDAAQEYFHLARQQKMQDIDTMLGLAAFSLINFKTERAVDLYLDVQDIDPKNKIAKYALSVIRKNPDKDALEDWLMNNKFSKLFPPIPGSIISLKTVFFASALIAVLFAAVFAIAGKIKTREIISPRPIANEFVLSPEERKAPVETGGSYKYILTRSEATDLYDKALNLFSSFRDEKAKINLNRLLESNASDGLKNRAKIMMSYMEAPGFDNYKKDDNILYAEVIIEPVLYRDVYVIWSGMATNVEINDNGTRFDFLVGYDTRTKLEGIVPVVFNKPIAINSERPLEVLGKILTVNTASAIMLEGAAIHQSAKLEIE